MMHTSISMDSIRLMGKTICLHKLYLSALSSIHVTHYFLFNKES